MFFTEPNPIARNKDNQSGPNELRGQKTTQG